jgi:anti-sigma28 factor (negative regulator of flagellin synthesis)
MMMEPIGGPPQSQGMTTAARVLKAAYRPAQTARATDSVELSSDVMRVRGVEGDIRLDKVMDIRRKIAEGGYFTPEKIDRALDRALDEALGVKR